MVKIAKNKAKGAEKKAALAKKSAAKSAAPGNGTKSIISKEYRDKMKARPENWFDKFIKDNAGAADDKGKVKLDTDALFELAGKNALKADAINRLRSQWDSGTANVGRIRMTIGNMLRAACLKRHGLCDIKGEFVKAKREFLEEFKAPDKPTQTRDGETIKAKAPKAAKSAAEATA